MPPAVGPSTDDAQPPGWVMLVKMLLSLVIGGPLFVGLWAGINFGFGTALDGPISAFIMARPCQRLDGTAERLTGYTLAKGGKGRRSSPSICHFGPRSVTVSGQIGALGFQWRELLLIVTGLVGYAVCFVSAGVGTCYLVRQGWRLLGRLGVGPGQQPCNRMPRHAAGSAAEPATQHVRRDGVIL